MSLVFALTVSSCSRLGYGVLLWSIEDPAVDSGTVLPVYIRSNIEKIWVVGIPENAKSNRDYKLEIPLTQLEFFSNKRKAVKWAADFAEHAMSYAENLQDGLPIRERADNNARRVYRLRLGEVIKILGVARGNPPIGATGDPLPGDWYRVMTNDGVIGYCFSYRLRIFSQNERSVHTSSTVREAPDPELESVLSKPWSPESYLQMISERRINLQDLERGYQFDPGHETGVARIVLPEVERQFTYDKITADGPSTWRFEGTNLLMVLRNPTTLAVTFHEGSGARRTFIFVSLPTDIDSLVLQESARRENQFLAIYNQGPVFTSNNYGTITLLRTGDFTWTGYESLVPQLISADTRGNGRINMDLFISRTFEDRYNGAFTLQFSDIRSNNTVYFLYAIDNQGLRLEVIPEFGIEDITVMRRSSSPMVLYFFKDTPSQ